MSSCSKSIQTGPETIVDVENPTEKSIKEADPAVPLIDSSRCSHCKQLIQKRPPSYHSLTRRVSPATQEINTALVAALCLASPFLFVAFIVFKN
ncbi:MAG: hypothetical protein AAB966_03985 [Patescibacteria group bacterium]